MLQRVLEEGASVPSDAVTLRIEDPLWREILNGETSAAVALAQGKIQIEGGTATQIAIMMAIFEA